MQIARLLRHALLPPWAVRRAFPPAVLTRIQQAIEASEKRHDGEIRFAIEASLPWSYLRRAAPARERALMVFSKLRVWDTEYNNGVLIYVALADHSVEVVADRGIAARVAQPQWQAICDAMRARFKQGDFEGGACAGIAAIGALLETHFPPAAGAARVDELPNPPMLL
jgi:uncharacterized membrane protein